MPWTRYEDLVTEFFQAAGQDRWMDFDYVPGRGRTHAGGHDGVRQRELDQIKTMLTNCVRGERFCDGHWGEMIERGHVQRRSAAGGDRSRAVLTDR